jgi:Flp pilus assembly pilin Flp
MATDTHRHKQQGQSAIEVALLVAMIALSLIGILRILGMDLHDVFCRVVNGIGLQTEACPGDGVIFWDDFTDGLDGWEIDRGGNWRVEDGELCAGPGGEHRAYGVDSDGSNYTISMDATLKSGNGYGVYFRADQSNVNGYTFQYDKGYSASGAFIFRKWINGQEMAPFQPWQSAPAGYQWYNTKRHVEISVQGNTYTAKVDGQVVATAVDSAVNPVPFFDDGRVGLRTWGGEACFDNVQITVP